MLISFESPRCLVQLETLAYCALELKLIVSFVVVENPFDRLRLLYLLLHG